MEGRVPGKGETGRRYSSRNEAGPAWLSSTGTTASVKGFLPVPKPVQSPPALELVQKVGYFTYSREGGKEGELLPLRQRRW